MHHSANSNDLTIVVHIIERDRRDTEVHKLAGAILNHPLSFELELGV